MLWRRKWDPTPVFLPGESHGQRSLGDYSPRGGKESDTTEPLNRHHRNMLQVTGRDHTRVQGWGTKRPGGTHCKGDVQADLKVAEVPTLLSKEKHLRPRNSQCKGHRWEQHSLGSEATSRPCVVLSRLAGDNQRRDQRGGGGEARSSTAL